MRRWEGNMNGERYLENTNTMEVHDFDNEKTNCQINEIIEADNDIPYDSLQKAKDDGYNTCDCCLKGSTR